MPAPRRRTPKTLARQLKPEEVLPFLEELERLGRISAKGPSRLISMKVPERLLAAFKTKARSKGQRYQTQIKQLMFAWLNEPGA